MTRTKDNIKAETISANFMVGDAVPGREERGKIVDRYRIVKWLYVSTTAKTLTLVGICMKSTMVRSLR